jgi:hypothetical protein
MPTRTLTTKLIEKRNMESDMLTLDAPATSHGWGGRRLF